MWSILAYRASRRLLERQAGLITQRRRRGARVWWRPPRPSLPPQGQNTPAPKVPDIVPGARMWEMCGQGKSSLGVRSRTASAVARELGGRRPRATSGPAQSFVRNAKHVLVLPSRARRKQGAISGSTRVKPAPDAGAPHRTAPQTPAPHPPPSFVLSVAKKPWRLAHSEGPCAGTVQPRHTTSARASGPHGCRHGTQSVLIRPALGGSGLPRGAGTLRGSAPAQPSHPSA
jgi:hypothetical protein